MFLSIAGPGLSPFLPTNLILLFIYADPGYGTLIWQLLLASFFGGMFYLRRLKDFVSRRKRRTDSEQ